MEDTSQQSGRGMGQGSLDDRFKKGSTIVETFLTTLPKRKTYIEWLLFLEKFIPTTSQTYANWKLRFLAAQKANLFADPYTDYEAEWYKDFAPEALSAFFEKLNEIDDEYLRIGVMSTDSTMHVPDVISGERKIKVRDVGRRRPRYAEREEEE